MAATAGKQLGTFMAALHLQKLNVRSNHLCSLLQVRNYAARKGTRERAKKKKVKVEVKKVGFIPHDLRVKKTDILPVNVVKKDDQWKQHPIDDVWIGRYYKWKIYPFAEAVECHRETHHPTCYNLPNAFISAFIELDMQGVKSTKPVNSFSRSVVVPNPFDHGENRTVMAFAKNPKLLEMADKAGATISGDNQLISKIQSGHVSMNDYAYVVAHPEIMAELSVIRGLMKRKFPNPREGTLNLDIVSSINKILHGIKYTAIPHVQQKLCGKITVPIGLLSMEIKQLEENLAAILNDVEKMRPKRDGDFMYRVSLISPPTTEIFKIDFNKYIAKSNKDNMSYDSDDDDEVQQSNIVQ